MSLAQLTEFFEVQEIPFTQNDDGNLVFNVEGEEFCIHKIFFTDTPYGWIRANVWTKPLGVKKVHRLRSLCWEMNQRFGHRVHVAFVSGSFNMYTFIRPDRIALELRDFVYACDKLVPLLTNMTNVADVGVWDDLLVQTAFTDIEGQA